MSVNTNGNENVRDDKKGSLSLMLSKCGRDFILGCLAFLPLVVLSLIIYYLVLSIRFAAGFFFGITESRATSAILIIFVILLLMYTGRKLRLREKWALTVIEQAITKIPIIGSWYKVFKDLIGTFTISSGDSEYLGTARIPFGDGYIIGFITKRETAPDGTKNVTVFVPTSPNPTTGLVFFFPEESLSYLDISPEQAFSRIISLGMK